MATEYDFNVFINCPFDSAYMPLFDASLFAVYKCGFRPRCALEADNAGDIRIEKINQIIQECRFGVHDISRTELDNTHSLPRFNMPLELGLFLGAKRFGGRSQKNKVAMIFDIEKYRYQKYISDISGQDIKAHNSDPESLIRSIRNTLNTAKVDGPIVGAEAIIGDYKGFQEMLPQIREALSLSESDVTYADKTQMIEQWLKINL
jgi:hypothetical protein